MVVDLINFITILDFCFSLIEEEMLTILVFLFQHVHKILFASLNIKILIEYAANTFTALMRTVCASSFCMGIFLSLNFQ